MDHCGHLEDALSMRQKLRADKEARSIGGVCCEELCRGRVK